MAGVQSCCRGPWDRQVKRTNFYYPEAMLSRLKALSQRVGLPVSELIRRAIDAYLKENKA